MAISVCVCGNLLARCSRAVLAEELTSETTLSAVYALEREPPKSLSTSWLLGIVRHRLVDYWMEIHRALSAETSGKMRSLVGLPSCARSPDGKQLGQFLK